MNAAQKNLITVQSWKIARTHLVVLNVSAKKDTQEVDQFVKVITVSSVSLFLIETALT